MNWQNDKEMLGWREVGDQSPLIRPGSPTYGVPHRGEAIKDPQNGREKEESSYKEPSPPGPSPALFENTALDMANPCTA